MVKKIRLIYSIVLFTLFFSCSNDPIVYTLTATADPAEGGQVVPEYMEYGEGDTAYVVASPSDEYVLESWSGDASGNANTLVITMDKNKDVTAHFVKKKYPLTIKIEGEGEVKQEVIKQGMARDYNSGTIVKLTAHHDDEWLFVRWRGDLTGSENPTQITIDGPKTVVAEFEKKKYPLTIEIVGEGQVAEKVIKPGAANDYNSGTIVELEALTDQSWEFSEWQVDLTGTENPKQITIDSPKTVRAVFAPTSPHDSDPIIGIWTLTNEVWVGSGTWPDGQARGCWKSGDGGSPDQYTFNQNSVTKKVWECDQDGNYISGTNETYGPFSWANLGNGSYSWAGGTIQVVFENNNTIMKLPFDDGNILQTWTKN